MGKKPQARGAIPIPSEEPDAGGVAVAESPDESAKPSPPPPTKSNPCEAQLPNPNRPLASELDRLIAKMHVPDGTGVSFDEWGRIKTHYPTQASIEYRFHQVRRIVGLQGEGSPQQLAAAEKALGDFRTKAIPEREKLIAERERIDAALAESERAEKEHVEAFEQQQTVRSELRRLTGHGVETERQLAIARRAIKHEFRRLPEMEARLRTIRGVLRLDDSFDGVQGKIHHVEALIRGGLDEARNWLHGNRTVKESAWSAYRARLADEEANLAPQLEELLAAKKKRDEEVAEQILDANWV